MKKILIIVISCLMLVGSVSVVTAEDNATETRLITETNGSVKAGEVSETITNFTLANDEFLSLEILSSKVSVKAIIYDDNHNLVHDVVTDYDAETETGSATLVFDLLAGSYTVEIVGIEGEGTFEYALSTQNIEIETIQEPTEEIVNELNELPNDQTFSSNPQSSPFVYEPDGSEELIYGDVTMFHPGSDTSAHYSSDTSVVTIDVNTGQMSAVGVGDTVITYTYLGETQSAKLLVSNVGIVAADGQILFHSRTAHMKQKFTIELAGKLYGSQETYYRSSNTAVATVSATGVVTAIKPGTAFIIATRGNYADALEVVVLKPGLSETNLLLKVSESVTQTVLGGSGTTKWKSSNSKVASVNSSGKITALKTGTATITMIRNGYSTKCKVVVVANSVTTAPVFSTIAEYPAGLPYVDMIKLYYEKTTLKMVAKVVNNAPKTLVKFNKLTIEIRNNPAVDFMIAKQTFTNISLNIGKYTSKNITFSFSKGTLIKGVDLAAHMWFASVYDMTWTSK